jgi:Rieske Fe-S protein
VTVPAGRQHPAGEPDREVAVDDPVWRQDFPLTSAGEDEVTRREFVRYLVLASGGFAAGSVGIALWSSLRSINEGGPRAIVPLDQVPEATAYLFEYPTDADPAILVHLPGGELRAFSQKCTHLGCVVYYRAAKGEMECPCHEGHFDADTGAVLAGPPQRPLGRIDVEVRNGTVWALAAHGEADSEAAR